MKIRVYEKTSGSWWLDIRHDGKRIRVPSGCSTKVEAEKVAHTRALEALAAGASVRPSSSPSANFPAPAATATGPTLDEAFRLALRTRESWIRAKDRKTLEQTFAHLGLPGDTRMGTLTRDRVRELREQWRASPGKRTGTLLSPSTINHRLSMLSVLLEACDLPPHTVKHLSTAGNRRTRRIAASEIEAARRWCLQNAARPGALSLGDLIVCALGTGARMTELLSLEWQDYSASERTLRFRDTKNYETRTIPCRPEVAALLEARRHLAGPFADLNQDRVENLWDRMRHDLGLSEDTEFVFHALRHESVSRMVDTGANVLAVQAWHGHKNITTTQRYAHASLGAMRLAAGMLAH